MRYKILIIAENSPGILYRIAGMFLRKKINIEKLFVKEVNSAKHLSHFVIHVTLDPDTMGKVAAQIERIVEVSRVQTVEVVR